jgi:hypothetical protein
MHDAIASGAMPRVDPWAANMAAVQAAKAIIEASKVPKPPKPVRNAASMFMVEFPDEVVAIIQSGDSFEDKTTAYLARQKIEDDKVGAREAAEFSRVVAAANLPTGPASLKRRREDAARGDRRRQQPGSNNTRPKKLPRVTNASSATGGQVTYSPSTLQQSRYQTMAPPSAPVSNNETQGVQQQPLH